MYRLDTTAVEYIVQPQHAAKYRTVEIFVSEIAMSMMGTVVT